MSLDNLVGTRGTVTIQIRGPEFPGEVMVTTRGGTQRVFAYATEAIPANVAVIIYGIRPGGVEVTRDN